jgi:hypothetical protein
MSLGQNPLLRKYNLAYRYREFGEVSLQASLPQRPLSVGMTWLYADDSYSQSDLGMTDSEENRYTFDVSWSVSDAATLYVTAGNESIEATQVGSETFSGPMWSAAHDDDFSHLGTGFRLTGLAEKMELGLDYTHSRGESDILVTGTAVSAASLPTLETDLDSLHLSLGYRISERLAMDVVLRYESFNMADWSLDGVRPATIPSVLTLGASSYDYDIWAVGVGFRYRVGK